MNKTAIPHSGTKQHRAHRLMVLRRRLTRNVILNTVSILLALCGMVWAGHFFWRYHQYEVTNDAVIDQYIAPINIRVSGYVKEVLFTEHQYVHAGDILLRLDAREYAIKLMDAQAALLEATALAEAVTSGLHTSVSNIAVSQSNIEEAKARLWKAEQEYKRYSNLLEQESVSQQQFEQVKAECEATRARYETLLHQRESTKLQSDEIGKKQGSADALILRRRADVAMAELNLSYTIIMAPYDGYMGRRTTEIGQLVQAGQTLSNLIRSDDKWVTANYKETQIANIYIGQPVKVRVDALRGRIFSGKVTAISEATGAKYSLVPTDNSAGNFVKIQQRIPVRIELNDVESNDMQMLRAGMMVETEAEIKR